MFKFELTNEKVFTGFNDKGQLLDKNITVR